jgi:hypothetical protein
MSELENKLDDFYPKYTSVRLHGSIANWLHINFGFYGRINL